MAKPYRIPDYRKLYPVAILCEECGGHRYNFLRFPKSENRCKACRM